MTGEGPLDPHERAARFALLAASASDTATTGGIGGGSAGPAGEPEPPDPDEEESPPGLLGRLFAPKETEDEAPRDPLYPRLLRLEHVHPNGWQRALLVEGMAFVGLLGALADKASWWAPVVMPVAAAAVIKFHDALSGVIGRNLDAGDPEAAEAEEPEEPAEPAAGTSSGVVVLHPDR